MEGVILVKIWMGWIGRLRNVQKIGLSLTEPFNAISHGLLLLCKSHDNEATITQLLMLLIHPKY